MFSANIYGMNRIVPIMPTYLNMRYIYGINLIAAIKGFCLELISANVIFIYFLFLEYGHYKIVSLTE